jgi:hypothetical protein
MNGGITIHRVKLTIVAVAILAIVFILLAPSRARIEVQAASVDPIDAVSDAVSPESLVDSFDKTVQRRFLTEPGFGGARLIGNDRPTGPTAKHMDGFRPHTDEEFSAVAAFEKEGLDVGIYLFGRRVEPRTNTKKANDYDIRYRLFNPIPVTPGLKRSSFRKQKKLANEAKTAFLEFQDPNSPNANEMKFEIGEWSYIARPVRASSRSCLQCHKDYVISDKLSDGKFVARPRRIGDVNGVLFYAVRKRDVKKLDERDRFLRTVR